MCLSNLQRGADIIKNLSQTVFDNIYKGFPRRNSSQNAVFFVFFKGIQELIYRHLK